MVTHAIILRTNRTLGRRRIRNNKDDFIFEDGTYFIKKEKVIIDKTSIRGKLKPTLIYVEGVAEPLYLDNLKFKEYIEDVPVLDSKNKPIMDEIKSYDGKIILKPRTEKKVIKKLEDIFIDSRAIHNMTDKKILVDLSTESDMTGSQILLIVLSIITIVICIVILGTVVQ